MGLPKEYVGSDRSGGAIYILIYNVGVNGGPIVARLPFRAAPKSVSIYGRLSCRS